MKCLKHLPLIVKYMLQNLWLLSMRRVQGKELFSRWVFYGVHNLIDNCYNMNKISPKICVHQNMPLEEICKCFKHSWHAVRYGWWLMLLLSANNFKPWIYFDILTNIHIIWRQWQCEIKLFLPDFSISALWLWNHQSQMTAWQALPLVCLY